MKDPFLEWLDEIDEMSHLSNNICQVETGKEHKPDILIMKLTSKLRDLWEANEYRCSKGHTSESQHECAVCISLKARAKILKEIEKK